MILLGLFSKSLGLQRRVLKKHATFARSDEGQRIVQLHLAGIPFAKSQEDMTPAQVEFFIEAINYMHLTQEQASPSLPTSAQAVRGGGEGESNILRKMVEARRRG